jgi:peptidoglycan/LPS O-acetylase OafA/YrhL
MTRSRTVEAAPASPFGGHMPALDGVRGLAILAVLLFHFVAQTTVTNGFEHALNAILNYGALGVDLFFILSGFLITGILYDSRAKEGYFRNFYMRRVLRIFPLYYAVLAVVFFGAPLLPLPRGSELVALRDHQAWAWLYAVNIYLSLHGQWVFSYLEHFWSLAVEEHFYFVWPFVVFWLGRWPGVLTRVALGVAACSLGGRMVASWCGVSLVTTTVLTPFQLDALCLGGFLAVYVRQPGGEQAARRAIKPLGLAAGSALVLLYVLRLIVGSGVPILHSLRGGVFRLAFAALLLRALAAPHGSWTARFFRSRPMVALGKYSYGLYVYHHFLSYYFEKNATEVPLAAAVGSHTLAVALQAALGMGISAIVAWASYEFFERHFLALKRFWPSAREATAAH